MQRRERESSRDCEALAFSDLICGLKYEFHLLENSHHLLQGDARLEYNGNYPRKLHRCNLNPFSFRSMVVAVLTL